MKYSSGSDVERMLEERYYGIDVYVGADHDWHFMTSDKTQPIWSRDQMQEG